MAFAAFIKFQKLRKNILWSKSINFQGEMIRKFESVVKYFFLQINEKKPQNPHLNEESRPKINFLLFVVITNEMKNFFLLS